MTFCGNATILCGWCMAEIGVLCFYYEESAIFIAATAFIIKRQTVGTGIIPLGN